MFKRKLLKILEKNGSVSFTEFFKNKDGTLNKNYLSSLQQIQYDNIVSLYSSRFEAEKHMLFVLDFFGDDFEIVHTEKENQIILNFDKTTLRS
ncbi:hypothetical protein JCM30760_07710 [Thiomicrorhabdus hydrogeniphila]